MSLTPHQEVVLKQAYQNLKPEPIPADSPLYENIYDRPGVDNPVKHLGRHIEFAEVQSIQVFFWLPWLGKND